MATTTTVTETKTRQNSRAARLLNARIRMYNGLWPIQDALSPEIPQTVDDVRAIAAAWRRMRQHPRLRQEFDRMWKELWFHARKVPGFKRAFYPEPVTPDPETLIEIESQGTHTNTRIEEDNKTHAPTATDIDVPLFTHDQHPEYTEDNDELYEPIQTDDDDAMPPLPEQDSHTESSTPDADELTEHDLFTEDELRRLKDEMEDHKTGSKRLKGLRNRDYDENSNRWPRSTIVQQNDETAPDQDFKYSFNAPTIYPPPGAPPYLARIIHSGEFKRTKHAPLTPLRHFRPTSSQRTPYLNLLRALEDAGILKDCKKPRLINGHFLRTKPTGELRLIFDGTRINEMIGDPPKFQMDAMKKLQGNILRYNFVAKDDIANAYYSFRVKDCFQPYLCINTPTGTKCFTRLPMGYNASAFVLHKTLQHSKLDTATYHGDDIQTWGVTDTSCSTSQATNRTKLSRQGFELKSDKTVKATQRTDILGITVDLKLKRWRPSAANRAKTIMYILRLLKNKNFNKRDIAIVVGCINWIAFVDKTYKAEAMPLIRFLIDTQHTIYTIDAFTRHILKRLLVRLKQNDWIYIQPLAAPAHTRTIWTDAASSLGIAVVDGDKVIYRRSPQWMHIGEQEALGVLKALELDGPINIMCDNQGVVRSCYKGSSANPIFNKLASLYWLRKKTAYTNIRYVRSADNLSDWYSRLDLPFDTWHAFSAHSLREEHTAC